MKKSKITEYQYRNVRITTTGGKTFFGVIDDCLKRYFYLVTKNNKPRIRYSEVKELEAL